VPAGEFAPLKDRGHRADHEPMRAKLAITLTTLVAGLLLAAPAPAQAFSYWTKKHADRYMRSYPNILEADCDGYNRARRNSAQKKTYRSFRCRLVYTNVSLGLALLAPMPGGDGYVYWVS
jgi:hypothetical protein